DDGLPRLVGARDYQREAGDGTERYAPAPRLKKWPAPDAVDDLDDQQDQRHEQRREQPVVGRIDLVTYLEDAQRGNIAYREDEVDRRQPVQSRDVRKSSGDATPVPRC